MAERETNINQFAGVNALAKRIEELTKQRDELTKAREDSQTKMLEEHGDALADLKLDLRLLVNRTENLPKLIEGISARTTELEAWRNQQKGERRAFVTIGGLIGSAFTAAAMAAWHLISGR